MICLSIYPNRGARFGHQFYEYAQLVALAKHLSGFIYLPKGLLKNSSKFNEIFTFGESELPKFRNIEVLHILPDEVDFFDLRLPKTMERYSAETDLLFVQGELIDLPWFSDYIKRVLSTSDMYYSLERASVDLYKQLLDKNRVSFEAAKRVAVHVRRENVTTDNINSYRYVSSEYFIDIIDRLVRAGVPEFMIDIFSTPDLDKECFKEFPRLTFFVDQSETDAFIGLCNRKFLVGSPSGFSYTASLVSDASVLVHPKDWNMYYRQDSFREIEKFVNRVSSFYKEV